MHPLARPQSENLDWQPTHAQLTHAVVAHQIGRWGAYHLPQAVQPVFTVHQSGPALGVVFHRHKVRGGQCYRSPTSSESA